MKKTISKVKSQPSEWQKITAKETPDKELISRINKQLMQFNTRKTNNSFKKVGRRPKWTFLQRLTMATKHMKRCSISLIIREMQIKTTMRQEDSFPLYHLGSPLAITWEVPGKSQGLQETWVQSLGQEDPLEQEMANPLQYSCMENSMDRGGWCAYSP